MENPKSCRFFTSQFQARKFLLEFEEPTLLGTAQCARFQPVYVIYRLLWTLWWVGFVAYDLYHDISNGVRWPIFVTNWALTVLTLSSILQLTASIYHVVVRPDLKLEPKMPVLYKIDWIFYEICMVSAVGVTGVFWGLLYEGTITFNGFVAHAINAVYVLSDLFITGAPIRILHFFHAMIFVVVYIIFTVIYQLGFGQDAIYSIFDWNNAVGQAVGVNVGMIVASFVLQILLFLLYWLKVLLCCSLKKAHQGSKVDVEMPDKY